MTGEEWLVTKPGAYLPGVAEKVSSDVTNTAFANCPKFVGLVTLLPPIFCVPDHLGNVPNFFTFPLFSLTFIDFRTHIDIVYFSDMLLNNKYMGKGNGVKKYPSLTAILVTINIHTVFKN